MLAYDIDPSCQLPHGTLALLYHTHFPGKTDGCYVEVGAYDGVSFGHTSALAKLGWRGLCIEPHPGFAEQCRRNHAGRNVTVEACAAGKEAGTLPLYVYFACSSTKDNEVTRENGIKPDRAIEVPVFTLDAILSRNQIPRHFEVLSIDVEEAEMDVLAGFDLGHWRPKVAIVETHELDPSPARNWKGVEVGKVFATAGYQKIYADAVNSIYLAKETTP